MCWERYVEHEAASPQSKQVSKPTRSEADPFDSRSGHSREPKRRIKSDPPAPPLEPAEIAAV